MRGEHHLVCERCDYNPSVCVIDGSTVLVCHCTHVDSDTKMAPLALDYGLIDLPETWAFKRQGEPSPINASNSERDA